MIRYRSRRGLASALIIMLLVLLIFFSVLSLVTTAADFRLARKRADWNAAYYTADSTAVSVLADLDRQMASLEPDDLQIDRLTTMLGNLLDSEPDVETWQIRPAADGTDAALILDALVINDESGGQGIMIRLLIRTGELQPGTQRIRIESWNQWQQEFDTSGSEGGIWKG